MKKKVGLTAPQQITGYECEVLDWVLTSDLDLIVLESTGINIYHYSNFKDSLDLDTKITSTL